jgi:hypothetical protein
MSLDPGTRLGPYDIVSLLGAGGMGEVYRARDTRLDRTVALKILPPSLASDPAFRERFTREGRAISQLDHPNICTLYDVGEQDGTSFLVMQYLEGETLESRLKKGALPLDQVLQFAIQIADALDKAHRAGIVHRDLKPGNVMLTKSGALLLDFGLAKTTTVGAAAGLSMLPTTPPGLTAQGTILGTFQYMAPEQLEGDEVDARTDIFAFGSVLFEMVTGRKAFEGKSQASLLAAIMHMEPPPLSTRQALVPESLDRAIRTCLAKDPDARWQSTADLRRELKWIAETPAVVSRNDARALSPRRLTFAAAAIGGVLGMIAGAGLVWTGARRAVAPSRPVTRFSIPLGPGEQFTGTRQFAAISRDGKRIAYVADQRIYLRSLDQLVPTPIRGAESAGISTPFFSPDGQWVGYADNSQIKRVSINGGTPVIIGDGLGRGVWGAVDWVSDDLIAFGAVGGVWRVRSSGGNVEPLVKIDEAGNQRESDGLAGSTGRVVHDAQSRRIWRIRAASRWRRTEAGRRSRSRCPVRPNRAHRLRGRRHAVGGPIRCGRTQCNRHTGAARGKCSPRSRRWGVGAVQCVRHGNAPLRSRRFGRAAISGVDRSPRTGVGGAD